MISGGLLAQFLHPGKPESGVPASPGAVSSPEGKALWHYAAGVCEGCERGGALLRELRSQLMAACGEAEAGALGSSPGQEAAKTDSV